MPFAPAGRSTCAILDMDSTSNRRTPVRSAHATSPPRHVTHITPSPPDEDVPWYSTESVFLADTDPPPEVDAAPPKRLEMPAVTPPRSDGTWRRLSTSLPSSKPTHAARSFRRPYDGSRTAHVGRHAGGWPDPPRSEPRAEASSE